jgi:hypothetical protein
MRNIRQYPVTVKELNEVIDRWMAEETIDKTVGSIDLYVLILLKEYIGKHTEEIEKFLKER